MRQELVGEASSSTVPRFFSAALRATANAAPQVVLMGFHGCCRRPSEQRRLSVTRQLRDLTNDVVPAPGEPSTVTTLGDHDFFLGRFKGLMTKQEASLCGAGVCRGRRRYWGGRAGRYYRNEHVRGSQSPGGRHCDVRQSNSTSSVIRYVER